MDGMFGWSSKSIQILCTNILNIHMSLTTLLQFGSFFKELVYFNFNF